MNAEFGFIASLLGAFFVVRAIVNLNRIRMQTLPFIAFLNLFLMLSGLGLALAPQAGMLETLTAALAILVVFAAHTLIGRRPGDQVLGG